MLYIIKQNIVFLMYYYVYIELLRNTEQLKE